MMPTINLFFSNQADDDSLLSVNKEVNGSGNRPRRYILLEQCINAAIVGGIAAFAAGDLIVALKAFGITFLIELRKYRKI